MRIWLIGILCICFNLSAQVNNDIETWQNLGVCDTNGYCVSKIKTNIRPKGLSLVYQRVLDYNIRSRFKDSSFVDEKEIRRNRLIEFKMKVPLVLKEKYNLVMGFNYVEEEFSFSNDEPLTNEFHRHLEDRPLKSIGTTFYLDRKFKGNHFLFSRAAISLNGDYSGNNKTEYLRSSLTFLYGTKIDSTKMWGYGLSYSYRFGRLALYPLLFYNKQFTEKWGFEMALPVKTEFRYTPNLKNIFYFTNQLGGANYVLDFEEISEDNLFFGKSHYLGFLSYEREIYDFIWLGVSVGTQININFDLDKKNRLNSNEAPFIDNQLDPAPFFRLGLYIVPPKKMYYKD